MKKYLSTASHLLLNPLFLLSLLLLFLNDHVFKGSGILPPIITGKLSDFTGLFCFSFFLSAVTGINTKKKLFLVNILIGIVFASIKSIPIINGWIAQTLNRIIILDPWDSLALLVLPLAGINMLHQMKTWSSKNCNNRNSYPIMSIIIATVSIMVFTATSPMPIKTGEASIVEITARSITIAWTPSQSAGGFVGSYEDDPNIPYEVRWQLAEEESIDENYQSSGNIGIRYTYKIENLEPDTEYKIIVKALPSQDSPFDFYNLLKAKTLSE